MVRRMKQTSINTAGTASSKPSCASRYVQFLQRFRWYIIALCLALAVLSLFAMRSLVFDNSNESFFQADDAAIRSIERFRTLFGNDDRVAVAVVADDIFQYQTLVRIKSLADKLEHDVPYVWRVSWVGNAEYLSGRNNEITSEPLAEEIPTSSEGIALFRKKALAYRDFVNTLVSEDGKIAVIALEFDPYPENARDPRKEIAPIVSNILKSPEFAGLETHVVGTPIQDYVSDEISARESIELGFFCLLVQGILLFRFGRGLRAVMAPLVTMVLSIIYTIGIIGAMGWPLSMMTIMLPTMLLCVCIGDCVHIIADYHRHRDLGTPHFPAMIDTMRECWSPCLVTSLTTMLGFASFLTTDIVPIQMAGLYSAIGVGIAFVLSITLTPVAYLIHPESAVRPVRRSSWDKYIARGVQKLMYLSITRPWPVIVFFVATAAASAAFYPYLSVETNYVRDLNLSVPLRQDTDFFDDRMGGSMSLEIMADSGREDGARKLAFLKDLESLQAFAEKNPLTTKTHSVADTVKRIHEVLYNEAPGSHCLPESDSQVSDCLFFYETSGGKNMDKELSFLSDVARIHIQTRTMSTSDVKSFMRDISAYAANELQGRIKIEFTGQMSWVAALSDYVVSGQMASFLAALISIGGMMIVSLRSIRMGLVSMLPNIVPIILPFGLMYLADVHISIVLMVFSSVIMGICVDDTTHFYMNFKRLFPVHNYDTQKTLLSTIKHVGLPVTYTTVSLVAGFAVFAASDVGTTIEFGFLAGAAFLWGWLADITFSPALLSVLKPLHAPKSPARQPAGQDNACGKTSSTL